MCLPCPVKKKKKKDGDRAALSLCNHFAVIWHKGRGRGRGGGGVRWGGGSGEVRRGGLLPLPFPLLALCKV